MPSGSKALFEPMLIQFCPYVVALEHKELSTPYLVY